MQIGSRTLCSLLVILWATSIIQVPSVQQFVTQGLLGRSFVEDVIPRTALLFRVRTPCIMVWNSCVTVVMPIRTTLLLWVLLALRTSL